MSELQGWAHAGALHPAQAELWLLVCALLSQGQAESPAQPGLLLLLELLLFLLKALLGP